MNKLLIIEDEQSAFTKIQQIFQDCWNVLPVNHGDIEYTDNDRIISYIKNTIINDGVSSIILDIALRGYEDREGFKIIEAIRKIDELKYKIIPVYCYSNYGNDKEYMSEAFKVGATNIFFKGNIDDPTSDEILFLKQSLTALSYIYSYTCGYALPINEVNKLNAEINDKLKDIDETTKTNLNAILQFSTFQNIADLMEINDANRQNIEKALGGTEILNNLLKNKWFTENKEQQEQLIDNVADIFSNIPVLSPIAAILKGITLISKNAK
jgi:PleD family two-component response regulator